MSKETFFPETALLPINTNRGFPGIYLCFIPQKSGLKSSSLKSCFPFKELFSFLSLEQQHQNRNSGFPACSMLPSAVRMLILQCGTTKQPVLRRGYKLPQHCEILSFPNFIEINTTKETKSSALRGKKLAHSQVAQEKSEVRTLLSAWSYSCEFRYSTQIV